MTGDRVRPGGARSLWLSSRDLGAAEQLLGNGVLLYPRRSRRWRWGLWIRRAVPWLLPTAVAALLVFPSLSDTPGLHGDEAWILRRVRELSAGTRPADGMTLYTGALHQYLVGPFVAVLGETVWAVRVPGAC